MIQVPLYDHCSNIQMQTVTILMGSPLSPILSNFYRVHIKIKFLTILPDLLYMFNILTNEKY